MLLDGGLRHNSNALAGAKRRLIIVIKVFGCRPYRCNDRGQSPRAFLVSPIFLASALHLLLFALSFVARIGGSVIVYETFPVGQLLCCSCYLSPPFPLPPCFVLHLRRGARPSRHSHLFSLEKLIVASGADGSDGDCQL